MHMTRTRKWVVGFMMVKVLEVLVLTFFLTPSARAADGEAAAVGVRDASRDQILQEIETTRQSNPELATEMERQLELMEAGEVVVEGPERTPEHLREAITHLEAEGKTEQAGKLTEVLEKFERGEITPEQCMVEAREVMGQDFERFGREDRPDEYLPPEVRTQLEKLFQEKGTGDPSKDAHVREEAERIMREHGIEPPKWEHEGEWEHGKEWGPHGGKEDWRDVVPPPVEGFGGAGEHGTSQEQHTFDVPEHSSYEAPATYEAPEQPSYEAPEPTTYEAPTYEAPTHEYEAPGPGDGSGMGPH